MINHNIEVVFIPFLQIARCPTLTFLKYFPLPLRYVLCCISSLIYVQSDLILKYMSSIAIMSRTKMYTYILTLQNSFIKSTRLHEIPYICSYQVPNAFQATFKGIMGHEIHCFSNYIRRQSRDNNRSRHSLFNCIRNNPLHNGQLILCDYITL